jgi:hypothetical protein
MALRSDWIEEEKQQPTDRPETLFKTLIYGNNVCHKALTTLSVGALEPLYFYELHSTLPLKFLRSYCNFKVITHPGRNYCDGQTADSRQQTDTNNIFLIV